MQTLPLHHLHHPPNLHFTLTSLLRNVHQHATACSQHTQDPNGLIQKSSPSPTTFFLQICSTSTSKTSPTSSHTQNAHNMSTNSLCSQTVGVLGLFTETSHSLLSLSRCAPASSPKFALPNIQTRTPQPLTRYKASSVTACLWVLLQSFLCISATSL